jgi:MSHA biogenesis protein MshO
MMTHRTQQGFTLIEMIMVIVITGIIGSMVAVFLKAPIQQYMDVSRRADMTDIADTALRRVGRDLRLALPNSVRVTGVCDPVVSTSTCFIEFLPTKAGGRYRVGGPGDFLNFDAPDTTFEVMLGVMPPNMLAGATPDQIVVYNLGIPGADAYAGSNRSAYVGNTPTTITIAAFQFPFDSPGHRFHVINTPVTYACDGLDNLWRYWGYPIQPAQPSTVATLDGLANVKKALLATHVSSCRFAYDGLVVAQRSGLVTMNLAITEDNETVTLYSATHVSNVP